MFTLNEEMVRKWYADGGESNLRYNYKLNDSSVVFDIGAYEGNWTKKMFEMYRCNIEVYEPVSRYFEMCKNAFRNIDKIHVHKAGVSDTTKKDKIFLDNDGSSIHSKNSAFEEIDLISIKDIMIPFHAIDLMKINVEGCEYEILECIINNNTQTKVRNFQIQFHNFSYVRSPEARRDDIRKSLSKTHHLTYDYPFVWENWEIN